MVFLVGVSALYGCLLTWWARQDLNLQEFPHVVLSHARLPFRHAPNLVRLSKRFSSLPLIRVERNQIILKGRNPFSTRQIPEMS